MVFSTISLVEILNLGHLLSPDNEIFCSQGPYAVKIKMLSISTKERGSPFLSFQMEESSIP